MKNRILAISAPGDDRGPGVMFRNHIKAVTHKDSEIEIVPLTQEIWDNDAALTSFDAAWKPLTDCAILPLNDPVVAFTDPPA